MRSTFRKSKEFEQTEKKWFLAYYLIRVIRLIAAISQEAKGNGSTLPVLPAQARKEGKKNHALK